MTVLQYAHEVWGSPCEMHHHRGRGKLPEPLDSIILASVIPCDKITHDKAHTKYGKRYPFDQLILNASREELVALIVAMDTQIDGLINRKDIRW